MIYVEWQSGALPGKVHLASKLVKTYCGKRITIKASETKKPRDKSKLCKKCVEVDSEQQRFKHLFS